MPFKFNPFTGTLDEAGSGGVGGGEIFNPGVAYIQTNGDDSTAQIGNPAKPFLTAQAAFDLGVRSFHLGVNLYSADATITVSAGYIPGDELRLFFSGSGQSLSVAILDLRINDNWTLYLESDKSMRFSSVTLGAYDASVQFFANNCIIDTLVSVNTNEEGAGPQGMEGRMLYCEVFSDSVNTDALALAYLSFVENSPRFQPPN